MKVITAISLSLTIFFAIYLTGSFVNASFDLKEWSKTTREVFGGFGGIISLIIGLAYLTKPNQR
jgi:hypothetical protein